MESYYWGIASNLISQGEYKNSFSARYNLDKLVYYEEYNSIITARAREKQLKAGNRARKIKLIEGINPEWRDLYDEI